VCGINIMMPSKEIAVIDLGSNTVRLSFYAIAGRTYRHLFEYDESERLRLIDDVDSTGNLTSQAVDATIAVLNGFRGKCASARVLPQQIVTVATSALRAAANRDDVVQKIETATRLSLRVLSAEEEAGYACRGVAHALDLHSGVVFDLGGGGLQIAMLQAGAVMQAQGFALGTLRLLRRFPNYAPMSAGQLEAMRLFVAGKLADQSWMREGLSGGKLVGIGGTVRALARIVQLAGNEKETLRGYTLTAAVLEDWVGRLAALNIEELLALPGLNPRRIDMVLFGAIIVRELMSAAGAKSMLVCDTSIRDGVALEQAHLSID
jgi:exopolyphosphatase / guanosine-5'-triphosphate,3'-diphosphate pyrophosphatase